MADEMIGTGVHRTAWRFAIAEILIFFALAGCGGGGGGGPSGYVAGSSQVIVTINTTDAPEIDTVDESITLQGTANGSTAINSVTWSNDRGGSGTASGTNDWTATGIPLELGSNNIVITGTDVAGSSGTDTIRINRESGGTGSATLMWHAPTERIDGTPLIDLTGYRIYFGRMSHVYDYQLDVRNPGILTYVVEHLLPGRWYFAVAAYDRDGVESTYSNEVSARIR